MESDLILNELGEITPCLTGAGSELIAGERLACAIPLRLIEALQPFDDVRVGLGRPAGCTVLGHGKAATAATELRHEQDRSPYPWPSVSTKTILGRSGLFVMGPFR